MEPFVSTHTARTTVSARLATLATIAQRQSIDVNIQFVPTEVLVFTQARERIDAHVRLDIQMFSVKIK